MRLGLAAAVVLLGTAPAIAPAATRPLHQTPEVKSLVAYDRADGTVLVVVGVAHVTRSTATAKTDTGRATVSLARRGRVVTGTDTKLLRGVQSRGAPVQYRMLLSPRRAAALGLRTAGAPRRVLVGLTVAHRFGKRAVSEARLTQSVLVRRVKRGTPSVARAADGGIVQVTTGSGFPPFPLEYGRAWNGQPPTTSVDWTWTSPYEPYFSSIIYDQAGDCLLQPFYGNDGMPDSGLIRTDGSFNMTASPGSCGAGYSTFSGTLSPVMGSDGTVPAGATMSVNMQYAFVPYGPATPGSAVLPLLPE